MDKKFISINKHIIKNYMKGGENKMLKCFKTEIFPSGELKEFFNKSFGIRRFVWNWGLNEYHNNPTCFSNFDWSKKFNSIKEEQFPWVNETWGKIVPETLKDLSISIKSYHSEQKKARTKNEKFDTEKFKPKFMKKGKCKETFRLKVDEFHTPIKFISKHYFVIRKGRGNSNLYKCKVAETLLFLNDKNNISIKEFTFSKVSNHYYISICYEKTNHKQREINIPDNSQIGIDMGIKHPFTAFDYNEDVIINELPKNLRKQEKRTEKLQRQLSRKVPNSNNYKKILVKLQNSYLREANIKKDDRYKTINFLVNNYKTIKIEGYTLNHKFNKNINRSMYRCGLYGFMEYLRFKCKEYETNLIEIPKGTPTTQTCSCCGNRLLKEDKLCLSDRVYKCSKCGNEIDRDLNASINIYNYIP